VIGCPPPEPLSVVGASVLRFSDDDATTDTTVTWFHVKVHAASGQSWELRERYSVFQALQKQLEYAPIQV